MATNMNWARLDAAMLPLRIAAIGATLAACNSIDPPRPDDVGATTDVPPATADVASATDSVVMDASMDDVGVGADAPEHADAADSVDHVDPEDTGVDAVMVCPDGQRPCGGACVSVAADIAVRDVRSPWLSPPREVVTLAG